MQEAQSAGAHTQLARDHKPAVSKSRFGRGLRFYEAASFWLLVSPWLIGFIVFTAYSMGLSLYWSFCNFDLLTPARWIGSGNYRDLFSGFDSKLFYLSLRVTTIFTFTSVPLDLIGGFAVALLMNQKICGINVFRTLYYIPSVTAGVATAMLWLFIFHPDFGVFNWMLSLVGIHGPGWLTSTKWALPALIIMSLWSFGAPMVIYLAGLQSVPEFLYEAAEIDGAGVWAKFRNITLPMLTPIIFYNLVMGIIGSFQVFTAGYVMTDGGPANATLFYVLMLYRMAFQQFDMGHGSAAAWVLFWIIIGFTVIQFRLASRWIYYEAAQPK